MTAQVVQDYDVRDQHRELPEVRAPKAVAPVRRCGFCKRGDGTHSGKCPRGTGATRTPNRPRGRAKTRPARAESLVTSVEPAPPPAGDEPGTTDQLTDTWLTAARAHLARLQAAIQAMEAL
jgi:hypothetical protein